MVYTQTQVAKELGFDVNRFWSLVNYRRLLPKPNEPMSENRMGYSGAGLAEVRKTVTKLRKDGIIK